MIMLVMNANLYFYYTWDFYDLDIFIKKFLVYLPVKKLFVESLIKINFHTGHGSFRSLLFNVNTILPNEYECGSYGHSLHYVYDLMAYHYIYNYSITAE